MEFLTKRLFPKTPPVIQRRKFELLVLMVFLTVLACVVMGGLIYLMNKRR